MTANPNSTENAACQKASATPENAQDADSSGGAASHMVSTMSRVMMAWHEFKREFRHALRGESRHTYVIMGWEGEFKKAVIGEVYAASAVEAIELAAKKESTYVIRSIREINKFISIQLLVTYPCRFARFVFAHKGHRDRKAKAIQAVLRLQTRKAVMKHINGKGLFIDASCPSDTAPDTAIPPHGTDSALALGDVVDGNVHDSQYSTSKVGASANAVLDEDSNGAFNTLAAVGYLTAGERLRKLHEFHENIHDKRHALRVQPQIALLNQFLLPGDVCPFCERHINEHPGPILGVDGIIDGEERPTLIGDQLTQPLIKDLSGHQREHGASPINLIHEEN